jgi:hypothetical protein
MQAEIRVADVKHGKLAWQHGIMPGWILVDVDLKSAVRELSLET